MRTPSGPKKIFLQWPKEKSYRGNVNEKQALTREVV